MPKAAAAPPGGGAGGGTAATMASSSESMPAAACAPAASYVTEQGIVQRECARCMHCSVAYPTSHPPPILPRSRLCYAGRVRSSPPAPRHKHLFALRRHRREVVHRPALLRRGVDELEVQLLVGGVHGEHEVEDLLLHLRDPARRPVDLVEDDEGAEALREG